MDGPRAASFVYPALSADVFERAQANSEPSHSSEEMRARESEILASAYLWRVTHCGPNAFWVQRALIKLHSLSFSASADARDNSGRARQAAALQGIGPTTISALK